MSIKWDSERMLNDTLLQLHNQLTVSPEGEVFDLVKLANAPALPEGVPSTLAGLHQ